MIEAFVSILVCIILVGAIIYNRFRHRKETEQTLQHLQALKDKTEKQKLIVMVMREIDLVMQETEYEFQGEIHTQTLTKVTEFASANLKIRLNRILK